MLTDKQSLLLCAFLVVGFFIGGILDILNNFVVLTILTISFLAIMVNLISAKSFVKNNEEDSKNSK